MKNAVSSEMATAAFANAQIHALSVSEPHHAGKYCYERKRNEREIHYTKRLRMILRIFKKQISLYLFVIIICNFFFQESCIVALF